MSKYIFNLKRSPADDRDYQYVTIMKPIWKLPGLIDYRTSMPPIIDQGDVGSCQTCALVSVVQFIDKFKYEPSIPFSYYCLHDVEKNPHEEDCGGTLRGTIKTNVKYGICSAKIWPNSKDWRVKPSAAAYKNGTAGKDELKKYYAVKSQAQVKNALAAGHLVYIGIDVYKSTFDGDSYQTGQIYPPEDEEESEGGHALDIVGYDDTKKHYIIRNSWGKNLGDAGYFYLNYADYEKLVFEAWVLVK